MCNATVITTPAKTDESVQTKNKNDLRSLKKTQSPQTLTEESKADHHDIPVVSHRNKERRSSESKTRFEHDEAVNKSPK